MNKSSEIILQCEAISKTFKEADLEVPVLHEIDFAVREGDSIAIMGASGAGKSTLLQLLGGLDNPTTGQVIIKGQIISELNSKKRGLLRNKYLGFVYQFHHLLPEFSALENVMMPLLIAKESKKIAAVKANELLDRVGLADRLKHRPAQLSGGERQRAAIARALVTKPSCLLADEPTGNLDEKTANEVMQLMLDLNKQENSGMIIVTHDLTLARQMDQIYELSGGQLVRK